MQREPALLKLSGAVDRYNCFTSLSVDRCFSTSVLTHSMLCYELEEEGQPLKLVRDSRRYEVLATFLVPEYEGGTSPLCRYIIFPLTVSNAHYN